MPTVYLANLGYCREARYPYKQAQQLEIDMDDAFFAFYTGLLEKQRTRVDFQLVIRSVLLQPDRACNFYWCQDLISINKELCPDPGKIDRALAKSIHDHYRRPRMKGILINKTLMINLMIAYLERIAAGRERRRLVFLDRQLDYLGQSLFDDFKYKKLDGVMNMTASRSNAPRLIHYIRSNFS